MENRVALHFLELKVQCLFVVNYGLSERKICISICILELKNSLFRDMLFLYLLEKNGGATWQSAIRNYSIY